MQAFAHHRARENTKTAALPRSASWTPTPADKDAPYAAYLLALSFYDQIDEVGRDQG